MLGQGVFLSMKQNKLSYNVSWKIFGLLNIQKSPNLDLLHVFDISVLYTCQLFLRYKREIFILWVLGFLRRHDHFRRFPKKSEGLPKKSVKSSEDVQSLSKAKFSLAFHFKNQRSRGRYCHLFILHMVFVRYMGLT